MKHFTLSKLTKAMLPVMAMAAVTGCNDSDSSTNNNVAPATPSVSQPSQTDLNSVIALPNAAPTPAANQIVLSYFAPSAQTKNQTRQSPFKSANTASSEPSKPWTLTCGEQTFTPQQSDQFGPIWVLDAASVDGQCHINESLTVTFTADDTGKSIALSQDGKKVVAPRQSAYLTTLGLEQAGTDVKLPEVAAPGEIANPPSGTFAIQLYDALGDYQEEGADTHGYGNFSLHLWNDAECNAADPDALNNGWDDASVNPDDADQYGPVWYVPITDDTTQCFKVIVRNGNKDKVINGDLVIDVAHHADNPSVTFVAGNATAFDSRDHAFEKAGPSSEFVIDSIGAIMLDDTTMVWKQAKGADLVQLMFTANGQYHVSDQGVVSGSSIKLTSTELTEAQKSQYPHLANYPAYELPKLPSEVSLSQLLKGSLVAVASTTGDANAPSQLRSATAVQYAGALDAIYAQAATQLNYGPIYGDNGVTFRLWAPTATDVELVVYNSDKHEIERHTMTEDTTSGSWSTELATDAIDGKYYRYAMKVFQPREQRGFAYEVTDPYSVSLSMNSLYSQAIDLNDEALKPDGWDAIKAPHSQNEADGSLSDMVIYESHVRDFSAHDASTENKGKYLAFTEQNSVPFKHLKALSDAGMTHLHLMPVFDIATINEDPQQIANIDEPFSKLCELRPDIKNNSVLHAYCASGGTIADAFNDLKSQDSKDNAVIDTLTNFVRGVDSYNWGYDPFHYTVPEGSYATNAEGSQRILEFRQMVKSVKEDLNMNLVVDVVYNHTNASGLNDKSVLDKVVPLYYHRLTDSGMVETSTCCDNTAPEHAMFAKLIDDSIQTWTQAYKIDAYRWDLMGHHPLSQIKQSLTAAREVNPEIYFYGEGWNFGEVADDRRFIQATQKHLAGTGIGSFSDRLRDAVRGGSPFDSADALRKTQGFATGAAVMPNELNLDEEGKVSQAELDRALAQTDLTRLGMAGNLKAFKMVDYTGTTLVGSSMEYGGQAAGYAAQPWEIQNYVSKHDNQTFWDINMYKVPTEATVAERVRMQTVGMATVLFGQAMPFKHMGGELLRSKSMQRDSYDFGDWFNLVDFTLQDSNWNKGLPAKEKDFHNYDQITRAVDDVQSQPSAADMEQMLENYKEMLRIRTDSPLISLPGADEILARVDFRNTGIGQTPGLIVMTIDNGSTQATDLDPRYDAMVVVINASPDAQIVKDFKDHQAEAITLGQFELHPMHIARGTAGDSSYGEGQFNIAPWSSAVFVLPREGAERGFGLPVEKKVEDLPPFGKQAIFVAGDFNGWKVNGTQAAYANQGLYKVSVGLAENSNYKFTQGDWEKASWGCGDDNCVVEASEMGMYTLTLDASDPTQPTVLAAELTQSYVDKLWFIPGTISGNWGHEAAQKMTFVDNSNVEVSFKSATLSPDSDYQFKLTCGDWGQCEHGAAHTVVAEDSLAIGSKDGNLQFFPPEEGKYLVKFHLLTKEISIQAIEK